MKCDELKGKMLILQSLGNMTNPQSTHIRTRADPEVRGRIK